WKHFETEKRPPRHASTDKVLWERSDGGLACRVVALSPSDADTFRGVQQLREFVLNSVGATLEYVPPLTPNEASVAAWISIGSTHILLGADLENPKDAERGWLAVLDDCSEWRGKSAEVFKVPHHGSADAY